MNARQPKERAEFYELKQNNSIRRWLVKDPDIADSSDDTWYDLKLGKYLERSAPVAIAVLKDGPAVDVNMTTLGNLILSSRAATVLAELAPGETQFFEAAIDDSHTGYKVVNILNHVDCLDVGLSDMLDPYPDGRIRVLSVAVDKLRVGSRNIFRVANWPVSIVITRRVKERFEKEGLTGGAYRPLMSSLKN
jgi:hypothetical protein